MDPTVSFPENWKAPRELTRALPRETQLSGRGIAVSVVAALLLVGAIPAYLLLHNEDLKRRAHTQALRDQGREASAEIRRLWHEEKSSTPMVGYAFSADGVRIAGQSAVPSSLWAGIQKVGFLPVRYLPSDPRINHPAAWEDTNMPAWVPFIFPVMLAASALLLLMVLRRQRELVLQGLATVGVVTRSYRVKGGWAARYQFRTKDGVTGKGSDHTGRRLADGTPLCVLYLPENPRRNQVYPVSLYRVAQ